MRVYPSPRAAVVPSKPEPKPKRVRKPKPAEPAPAVAAEGLFALLGSDGVFRSVKWADDEWVDVGTKAEASEVVGPKARVVRVFEDGAHEAAVSAAREEGRREGASRALATCRAQLEHWLDLWRHRVRAPEYPGDEVASGAKIEAYEQAILTIDEATKGAAK